jgi:type II pantothenate kinase
MTLRKGRLRLDAAALASLPAALARRAVREWISRLKGDLRRISFADVEAVRRLAAQDGDLEVLIRAGMMEVASNGSRVPLLDLRQVPEELNEAAADADLVVLVGMGRAVETNLNAAFKVDSLRLALLKNPRIAQRLGGDVFDCVCKYVRADGA